MSLPLSSASASKPVRCTVLPPTSTPRTAALAACSARGFSPNAERASGRELEDTAFGEFVAFARADADGLRARISVTPR